MTFALMKALATRAALWGLLAAFCLAAPEMAQAHRGDHPHVHGPDGRHLLDDAPGRASALMGAAAERAQYGRRGFVRLADLSVRDGRDRDVIRLPGRQRFNQLKLCVSFRAVEFFDFDVRFANGGNQDVRIRRVIGAGECTRNINLAGRNSRDIRAIVLKYTSLRKRGPQPVVSVFAR